MALVDAQFPPVMMDVTSDEKLNIKEEFNTFNYWREPVADELPLELLELLNV